MCLCNMAPAEGASAVIVLSRLRSAGEIHELHASSWVSWAHLAPGGKPLPLLTLVADADAEADSRPAL